MYKYFVKRFLDIVFSVMALLFLFVILLLIGPIIYVQDKGNIFYNANRLGKDGNVFKMYKLRSMKINSSDLRNKDGSTYNAVNDPRLTKVGKFIRKTSIDEIPQVINVLKGEMSFIGPRPDLPEHLDLYERNEIRKLEVRPGITGYSQAYYRNTIPWKDRISNDIYYIDNLTLWMDVRVFFKTIISVIKTQNVFSEQQIESKKGEKNNGK